MDLDGYDDLAVGAPYDGAGGLAVGKVYVLSGFDGALLLSFEGSGRESELGAALAAPGDVNQDGWPDLLVGAPGDDLFGTDSGTARLYSGRDGSTLFAFRGASELERLGASVAGAGDVNGDGHPDLMVGAQASQNGAQGAYAEVRSGRDGALIYRVNGLIGPAFVAVNGAGDVDGDGLDDVLMGETRFNIGAVHLVMGPTGAVRKSVYNGANFGRSVHPLDDWTGDGRPEILIGVRGEGSGPPRFVYVWDSATNMFPLTLQHTIAGWGETEAVPGDMNGDGRVDFVIGSTVESIAYLHSGKDGTLLWPVVKLGDSICDELSFSSDGAGDVNGDGHPDLLLGAPGDSHLGACHPSKYGSVLVFSLREPFASNYCTAKVSSQGCTPRMSYSGTPSATGTDDFVIRAHDIVPSKSGMLLWSLSPAATPFQGGTLCLGAPVRRTAGLSSGGGPSCSGSFQFFFTQPFMWKNLLFAGSQVFAQFWYRDPASTGGIGLTDGLEWIIGY